MRLALLISLMCGCASTSRLGAEGRNCLDDFNARFSQSPSAEARGRLVEALGGDEMQCLFESATQSALTAEFFTRRTTRFQGVNSLPVGRYFEKRVTLLPDGERYGSNASSIGRVLASPGLFHVHLEADGSATFGYSDDFVHDLERKGLTARLLSSLGLRAVQNNGHNLLFHDLVDIVRRVNGAVAVGRADRVSGSQRRVLSYFVIVRADE